MRVAETHTTGKPQGKEPALTDDPYELAEQVRDTDDDPPIERLTAVLHDRPKHVRDAVLLLWLDPALSRDDFTRVADNDQGAEAVTRRVLGGALRDPDWRPDETLTRIADRLERFAGPHDDAQILGMAAYLHYLTGNTRQARKNAFRAIDLHDRGLAETVIQSIDAHLRPAWLNRATGR